ncbi:MULTISPECIES: WD40/YVTN/BNR-like repeat-containing protein [Ramlibacter]|uniref:Exo-alpha-sialidase n=1 Tax=Ramlibacter pinisoli TaxID=2682844 RepID=A0A6N8IZD2_9BURK|nr:MULTISPECIES: hypothetical protein [Ramlibacter]MBA2961352.1 hypothetical protein [Ramlibacter sp. CGMCC 1.13660]MVQ31296.1 hypothetical protein [Ramlibacter pinisoli]
MIKRATRQTIHITAALAALWLTACGGGGGGDGAAAPIAGGPPPAPAPAPGPAPAPAPVAGTTLITGDTQAAANQSYGVNAAGAGPVTITLPATAGLAVGDTVSVTGVSAAAWQIAQNAGQTILTGAIGGNPAVTGNVLPGTTWTPSTIAATPWHSVAMNPAGDVVLATNIRGAVGTVPSNVHISTDGGATFANSADLPVDQAWIQADMSADGQRMVAIAFGGGMWVSTNKGVNWTQVSGGAAVNLAARDFESVTMSDDGQRITAVIMNGPVVSSANGGTTWVVGTSAGAALTKPWRSVDSSPDGLNLVAVSQAVTGANGQVYTSADGGATWTLRPVTVTTAGAAITESGWYRTRMSRVGNVIAIAANSTFAGGSGASTMYISRDLGATWTASGATGGDFTGIAMDETGTVIGATSSNGTAGSVQLSTDGGTTFQPLTVPGATNFRQIAMDRFGAAMAVVTGTFTTTSGQLFTSIGNRTTTGTTGALAGGDTGESLQLRHEGNGVFSVTGSTGSFTPR